MVAKLLGEHPTREVFVGEGAARATSDFMGWFGIAYLLMRSSGISKGRIARRSMMPDGNSYDALSTQMSASPF